MHGFNFSPFWQTESSYACNFLSNHHISCHNILLKMTFQIDINRLEGCPNPNYIEGHIASSLLSHF